ncbi:hypothetical protein B7463_g12066, partial [Scytalidium lignicola]
MATVHYTELSIYEMANMANTDPTANSISTPGFERLEYLYRTAEKLEQTSYEAGERSGDDIFAQVAKMTRTFKAWVIVETMPTDVYGSGATNAGETMTDSFDFGSEMWMENFFGRS